MDCCLLSSTEVARLRNYKLLPCHDDHVHIPPKDAIKGLNDEIYELIQIDESRYGVTLVKQHTLRRTRSGHIDTIQRVIGNPLLELMPIR